MQFTVGRPDMIRAISQRWLLKFWKRCLKGRDVPLWQSVEAEELVRLSAGLSLLEVEPGKTPLDNPRFRIGFHGAMIGTVYGSSDCRGRYLDDVLSNRCSNSLIAYYQVIAEGCPVYTIHDIVDRTGRTVQFERLLLPFASQGDSVDRILASFEFICIDGAFESRELMKMQMGLPTLRVSATIDRNMATL
ncbi:MAG: PAS domain-containing protein [Rhodopseudomonas sp.]|nr:PAS domain-containing protein [Rhodopseudomonas sp.]